MTELRLRAAQSHPRMHSWNLADDCPTPELEFAQNQGAFHVTFTGFSVLEVVGLLEDGSLCVSQTDRVPGSRGSLTD